MNMINCWALALLSALSVSGCKTPTYDPLLVSSNVAPKVVDLDVSDTQRKRNIPIRVYLPATTSPAVVILFSHGLGGSREGSTYLGKHWSSRGYVAVFLQHPGSDTSVWKEKPASQRMSAMREAASGQNFLDRVKDVPAVLDQLERWNKEAGHTLAGKLNLTKVGMSGHSFGAVTTQAVSGQTIIGDKAPFTDPRIAAAVIMSPSSPRRGTAQSAFGKITLPWLLMTGTKDVSPIGDIDVASRLAVYPALPAGSKYELLLNAADHSAFTDRPLPTDNQNRNPNHHRSILALSTAFWDAYLLNNTSAKTWLNGEGAKSVLEKADKWQRK
ncbi:MAG: dienelactone hydrolase [bacterium]